MSYFVAYFKTVNRIIITFTASCFIQNIRIFPSLLMEYITNIRNIKTIIWQK